MLNKLKNNKRAILVAVILAIVILALYRFRGLFVAATIDGHQISRIELTKELEAEGGAQALDTLVTRQLILDEAKKQNVTADKADIDKQVATIEAQLKTQNQTLDQALAARGMTKSQLEEQLKVQVLIQKLLSKTITVSDKEIDDYIKQNKSTDSRAVVKDTLTQQKLASSFQTWIDGLKTKAKINYFVSF